jgi:hypothetical protein
MGALAGSSPLHNELATTDRATTVGGVAGTHYSRTGDRDHPSARLPSGWSIALGVSSTSPVGLGRAVYVCGFHGEVLQIPLRQDLVVDSVSDDGSQR